MAFYIPNKCETLLAARLLFPAMVGGVFGVVRDNFAANLKRLMKEKKLTGEELALKLNCSSRAVYEWTRGKGLPRLDRLDEIAAALDTDFLELVRDPKLPLEEQIALNFLQTIAEKLDFDVVRKKKKSDA